MWKPSGSSSSPSSSNPPRQVPSPQNVPAPAAPPQAPQAQQAASQPPQAPRPVTPPSSGAPSQPSAPAASSQAGGSGLKGYQPASTHFPDGLTLNGDLNADEDVVIDGVVTGAIDMPGHALTIGATAKVDARILARDITVHGSLNGKATAIEIIDIREKARVSGEIAAPSVALADGARVQGRVETKRVDAAVHVARYRMNKGGAEPRRA